MEIRFDQRRGCGDRKPGGLYLVSDGVSSPCMRLPIPLTVCPTCGEGYKHNRGFTWIDADKVLAGTTCGATAGYCQVCPISPRRSEPIGRCGLLWIGEKFYPTPADWTNEAYAQGVSRRISTVPKELELGKTLVLVAHRKVIRDHTDGSMHPGIFHAFIPSAVEYVAKGDESDEEIEALRRRKITPVQVVNTTPLAKGVPAPHE